VISLERTWIGLYSCITFREYVIKTFDYFSKRWIGSQLSLCYFASLTLVRRRMLRKRWSYIWGIKSIQSIKRNHTRNSYWNSIPTQLYLYIFNLLWSKPQKPFILPSSDTCRYKIELTKRSLCRYDILVVWWKPTYLPLCWKNTKSVFFLYQYTLMMLWWNQN